MQTPSVRSRADAAPSVNWWRGEKNVTTFHFSWLRLYAAIAAWQSVLLLIVCLLDGSLIFPIFLGYLLSALIADLILAAAVTLAYPIRVSENGLQGFNFWGLFSRMRWDEIEAAVPSHLFGLPWLRVRAPNRRSDMWLPLFYSNRRAFYEAVAQHAPADCPILPDRVR